MTDRRSFLKSAAVPVLGVMIPAGPSVAATRKGATNPRRCHSVVTRRLPDDPEKVAHPARPFRGPAPREGQIPGR